MFKKPSDEWLYRFLNIVFAIAVINFIAVYLVTNLLHGDGLNGFVHNGHYFVNSHGVYTEVTEQIWTLSRYHMLSLFITHPLGIICIGYARAIGKRLNKELNSIDLRKMH